MAHQTIREGSTGADVTAWQALLGIKADGVFGPATKRATMAWQADHGLTQDGVVGPLSWSMAEGKGAPVTGARPAPVPAVVLPSGEVPNKLTPLTPEQATEALRAGYREVTGSDPSALVLALLVGQSALETGNWKAIHNFNFGNKKASSGDRSFQFFRCSEVENGVEVFYDPPSPKCRFAAYGSASEGAAAFVRLLKSRPHWWDGLQSGTVDGFLAGLTQKPAYFTASPSLYRKVLAERMGKYASLVAQFATSGIGGAGLAVVGGLLVGGLLWWARSKG